ncbi:PBSX family phage terminase large subunit [Nonomuraea spiralis]|uniref:PBSX family phage terminase large subunit n=1 Tax=Nonomuraea spiralis TaxID=46182 RepID=A0ABV5IYF5_9ACTN|nr:PBSX family phage terminase large subunit [Nonomuraea spiralis]GGS88401.1 phage terminase large subunit [Nonomuraea spiralis]
MTPRLSNLQERSIAHSTARINIWSGAVRSGKTISSLLRWLEYVGRAPRGGALVVSGKTFDTVSRNVFGPLQDPAVTGPAAKHIKYTRGASTATILGRQVEVITANDEKAEGRLRGLTAAGAYVDELTLIPESFFQQLLARLSVPGAKVFCTTNPDGPAHWARKKFILRQGDLDLRHWHFTLDDNPALDPAYVAALKSEYVGLWYRRFIKGEWCLASGAIFDTWDETTHVVDVLPPIVQWIACGVDYGTVNPFAALMLGLGADGRLYFTREWRYDSKLQRRSLTDIEYATRMVAWMDAGGHPRPTYVVVDPSAASFRVQLHQPPFGIASKLGDNEVVPGIMTMSSLLATDRLKVHRSCQGWLNEVPGYSWDDEKAEKDGEDVPVKVDDHSLDAGRYAVHTTRSVWQFQLREPTLLAA